MTFKLTYPAEFGKFAPGRDLGVQQHPQRDWLGQPLILQQLESLAPAHLALQLTTGRHPKLFPCWRSGSDRRVARIIQGSGCDSVSFTC